VPALRVRHHLPSPAPGVSLIIPTRDQPDLLAACLDGLLRRTEYSPMEVLLVDNGSTDPRAVAVLDAAARDPRVRVIRQPGPFNWSHLNNVAARQARGDVLVLLNNDTATIDPHWLTEMVSHAIRPEIGAVGAKLLYPDGRVQHAGVAIDDAGGTKHLYRFRRDTDPGPVMALATTRGVTAVTGACLAVRRAMYLEIGGPTETLAIASNDVDLCLRLAARGYRNLWTPFAVVEHRELATRGADTTPEMQARAERELRQLRRDWGGALAREPHLNANLVVVDEDVRLRAGTTAA
jgi:GT2 family glycosyltransferase